MFLGTLLNGACLVGMGKDQHKGFGIGLAIESMEL